MWLIVWFNFIGNSQYFLQPNLQNQEIIYIEPSDDMKKA